MGAAICLRVAVACVVFGGCCWFCVWVFDCGGFVLRFCGLMVSCAGGLVGVVDGVLYGGLGYGICCLVCCGGFDYGFVFEFLGC